MQRRNLIGLTLAGVASGLISKAAFAKEATTNLSSSANSMAGGVFYTKDAPGRWKGKEKGHLPIIEIKRESSDTFVQITTSHEMKKHEHYIIKHILLDGNFRFIGEKMFDPLKDKAPISRFRVGKYKGPFYALSVCNKHDTWLDVGNI
uniref:Superoxide reductase n=1 Tax=Candidatus Kentrum sp. MB TaxID=2138164 RepID=A0A450Y016_9GAMM|nr:MAG: superoxide reductase [Candidatus Kentron sp. MB]VFK34855.1 MAG: superoxide reductase [Candidatus Kentron sp. MB]VFK77005.1 MAG: superoxide reductase [Candidatus Kentron sp. MB]